MSFTPEQVPEELEKCGILTESSAHTFYQWFDTLDLEGNPSFDDLNEEAQAEFVQQWRNANYKY